MAERPQFVPIEQLEARHQKVSSIVTSREQKIAGLPSRPDDPLELMNWRRRELAASALQKSIDQRLKPEIGRIELQMAEQLVPVAREYEEQLSNRQRDLRRIELRVASGRMNLSPEELEQFRVAVRELEEKPLRNSILAKALEMTRQPIQPTTSEVAATPPAVQPTIEGGVQPEEENLPNISLDEESRILTVDGTSIVLGPAELIVIKPLFDAKGSPVDTNLLKAVLKGKGYSPQSAVHKFYINKKAKRELVKQTGSRQEGFQYTLPRLVSEEVVKLEAEINELKLNLAQAASEPLLAGRIQEGIKEREKKLLELNNPSSSPKLEKGIASDSSQEEPLNPLLLSKYDKSYATTISNLLKELKALNDGNWTYDRIYREFGIHPDSIKSFYLKGFFGSGIPKPRRWHQFTLDEVTTLRYFWEHEDDFRNASLQELALEVKVACETIAERLRRLSETH